MVSVAVWTSVPCGVWPLVPGPANIHEYEIFEIFNICNAPPSPRCRHYTERCVVPSVRLLAAVTALLLQLPHHGGGLVTVDTVLAGGRHVTKRGRGPRWLIVLLISYLISYSS